MFALNIFISQAEGIEMATHRVHDNILIKLESVFLKVEREVDQEISDLLSEERGFERRLKDLKTRLEALNSLKRSYELYCDNEAELHNLKRSLFKILGDKQIQLRMLSEKQLLLESQLIPVPDATLPSVIELNKDLKIRKRLQEIELLSGFLAEHPSFNIFRKELDKANQIYDLAIESGALDKLEETINLFQNFFEKIENLYDLDEQFLQEFGDFKAQIALQANAVPYFTGQEIFSTQELNACSKRITIALVTLENEVDRLLFQFTMLQSGKKVILLEIKNTSGELESIIFKEYALRQKIQELRQYKIDLNSQKENFMKDPTVDGYNEAVRQLESAELRFKRLVTQKNQDKQNLINRFFAAHRAKTERKFVTVSNAQYQKTLFQALHNCHICGEDKITILRLSKPSTLINANTGHYFYQRAGKVKALANAEQNIRKFQLHEVH